MYQPKDEVRGTYLTAYEAQLNAQIDKIMQKRRHHKYLRQVTRPTRMSRGGVAVLVVKALQ